MVAGVGGQPETRWDPIDAGARPRLVAVCAAAWSFFGRGPRGEAGAHLWNFCLFSLFQGSFSVPLEDDMLLGRAGAKVLGLV